MSRSTVRLCVAALVAGATAAALALPAGAASAAEPTGETAILMNYTVNSAKGKQAMADVKAAVKAAGGTVIRQYKKIGVTVAQSDKAKFAKNLRKVDGIEGVGATRTSAVDAELLPKPGLDETIDVAEKLATTLGAAAIDPEPREGEQWGLTRIHSRAANEINPGDKNVLVGILDAGSNDLHEDLQATFNRKASVDCQALDGIPDKSDGAWRPTRAHGTHTAGTVAAARNGIGVAGVAPGVQFAAIKVSNDAGFYFAEYVLCGYWWAYKHGVDVTNNSYYMDPWMFWCDDDPDQGAVQESLRRMITFTQKKGMINVAAAGNANYDLAHKTTDSSSPNDSDPIIDRPINEGCLDIPAEIPGVVTVAALGQGDTRASFSNYGKKIIDVTAPGVGILSTWWPGESAYASASGTSMASPHVAGVFALAKSAHPDMTRKQLLKLVYKKAESIACPADPACEGKKKNNGFFGHGVVDALGVVE